MIVVGKRIALVCLGLALVLGACQPPMPVKVPQASLGQRTPTALPVNTLTPLPASYLSQPEPAQASRSSNPTTWTEAIAEEPKTLDPALEYETSGSNILARVYDPLVTYRQGNLNTLLPALAEQVPSRENGGISADGRTYTFAIRPKVQFHDGALLTASDVAYSFQRGLLQGGTSSPQWLLAEALLGAGVDDVAMLVDALQPPYDDRARLSSYPADLLQSICKQVKAAVSADDIGRKVTFHLKQPWSPFLPTLAGSWGSITSQAWVKDHGGWDGDCTTWQNYYAPTADENMNSGPGRVPMGTGPYRLNHWTGGKELVLTANPDYWDQDQIAPLLNMVVLKKVPEFSTRLELLRSGQVDAVETPREQQYLMDELVGEVCSVSGGQCWPSEIPSQPLRRWEAIPSMSRLDVLYNFNIDVEDNPYTGSGELDGEGIPANFFADVHVRRAFSYCFDGERYRQAVFKDAGSRARTLMPPGLSGYQADSPGYEYNLQRCTEEFQAAALKSVGGRSLWETGFRMAIPYPTGNTAVQTVAQIWQQVLSQVNPKFVVSVTGIPWPAYVSGQVSRQLPLFYGRWVGDVADSHNWVAPYINGCFASRQDLPPEIKQQYFDLTTRAAQESDPRRQADLYLEFNRIFYENASALLLYQVDDRVYLPRYVSGWTTNPLLPGAFNWAELSKE